jgi:hypothetical protein
MKRDLMPRKQCTGTPATGLLQFERDGFTSLCSPAAPYKEEAYWLELEEWIQDRRSWRCGQEGVRSPVCSSMPCHTEARQEIRLPLQMLHSPRNIGDCSNCDWHALGLQTMGMKSNNMSEMENNILVTVRLKNAT